MPKGPLSIETINSSPRFSRRKAALAGETRYVNGKPCPQGHIGERHTANGKCCACSAEWKKKNVELVREGVRRHRRENPAMHKSYRDKYNKTPESLERRRKWANAKYAKKRLTPKRDPIQKKISNAMRCRMWCALRIGKGRKSWESFVDYSVDDLRVHIERQWTLGMTWENYSQWDIDHILPVAGFVLKEYGDAEFRSCWALSNLRPLWTSENRSKGAKRLHLL